MRLTSSLYFLLLLPIVIFARYETEKYCPYSVHRRARKIYNGATVKSLNEVPWNVALENRKGFIFCSGTIVANDTVVSAAHCADAEDQIFIRIGTLSRSSGDGKRYEVTKKDYERNFGPGWDIALLTVSPAFEFNENVTKISLPDGEVEDGDGPMTIVGWGALNNVLSTSDELMISDSNYVERVSKEYEGILCVIGEKNWPCGGDSGAGLIYKNKLVGVISAGPIYCEASVRRVFTSVYFHKKHILNKKLIE